MDRPLKLLKNLRWTPPPFKVHRTCANDLRISEEAAEWLSALESDEPVDHVALAHWLKRSTEHVESFLLLRAISARLRAIGPERLGDVAARLKMHERAQWISSALPANHKRMVSCAKAGIALCLLILGGGLLAWFARLQGYPPTNIQPVLTTRVGEQRTFPLQDGSMVVLNSNSVVEVALSAQERALELKKGEARFKVEPDRNRPFTVRTPQVLVKAVGTVFNIHTSAAGTNVAVLEGAITVTVASNDSATQAALALSTGQQAHVSQTGEIELGAGTRPSGALDWPKHRLTFKDEPVGQILTEVNRYYGPQIRLMDAEIAQERLTVSLPADDFRSLTKAMEMLLPVSAQSEVDGSITLTRRRTTPK
jgi:transmembrane sensor